MQLLLSAHSLLVSQQLATGAKLQVPLLQLLVVQARPSSQSALVLQQPGAQSWAQKPVGAPTQTSVVQAWLSLQSEVLLQHSAGPWLQVPPGPEQLSRVQRSASSQSKL